MISKFTAYIEKDVETGCYVAVVPGIPGAHTQADTLDELQVRLKEVIELCLEEMSLKTKNQFPSLSAFSRLRLLYEQTAIGRCLNNGKDIVSS